MKRMLRCVMLLLVCATLICPVHAFAGDFVQSITYKGEPTIVPVLDDQGNEVIGILEKNESVIDYVESGCLVVTSVAEAETSDEIPNEAREELISVYAQLRDGSMNLPYEDIGKNPDAMVIRDLFDLSFVCDEHFLPQDGVTMKVTFDLGIECNMNMVAMVYHDGQWSPVVGLVNNGDGTVTVEFDRISPVAFAVEESTTVEVPSTGDNLNIALWSLVMASAFVALVVVIVVYRRKLA